MDIIKVPKTIIAEFKVRSKTQNTLYCAEITRQNSEDFLPQSTLGILIYNMWNVNDSLQNFVD